MSREHAGWIERHRCAQPRLTHPLIRATLERLRSCQPSCTCSYVRRVGVDALIVVGPSSHIVVPERSQRLSNCQQVLLRTVLRDYARVSLQGRPVYTSLYVDATIQLQERKSIPLVSKQDRARLDERTAYGGQPETSAKSPRRRALKWEPLYLGNSTSTHLPRQVRICTELPTPFVFCAKACLSHDLFWCVCLHMSSTDCTMKHRSSLPVNIVSETRQMTLQSRVTTTRAPGHNAGTARPPSYQLIHPRNALTKGVFTVSQSTLPTAALRSPSHELPLQGFGLLASITANL